ncbi:MAG: GSCFA domain-containing protein [Bacteroidales bacterium]
MNWQTKVEISSLKEKILYNDNILFMGSCFAGEVGVQMKDLRFLVLVNPFGVMFNPASVALSLERLDSCDLFKEEDILKVGDLYKSFYHGSEFVCASKEKFLESNNEILKRASLHFHSSKRVIITLGTSWIYKDKISKQVVSNCHKFPASNFERAFLSIEESVALLSPLIEKHKDKQWILTVSPVRHLKDGAHTNQLSKSRLLIAADLLAQSFSNVVYFPAYEIFMDELRDYRFYASDMVHPSALAIKYVWERFKEFAIDSSCDTKMKMVDSLNKMRNHRPLFPESKDYKVFLNKIEQLEEKLSKLQS